MSELTLLAPGTPPGAVVRCKHCQRPLRDALSRMAEAGPVCEPRHHPRPYRAPEPPVGPVGQLDLLAMLPEPEDWPLASGALVCGRCGAVLAPVGWTLREALAAVEGHAEACA